MSDKCAALRRAAERVLLSRMVRLSIRRAFLLIRSSRHLVHVFPTFAIGGSQMRFAQLAAAHGDRYHHTVLALDGKLDIKPRLLRTINIQTIVPQTGKSSGIQTLRKRRRILRDLKPDTLVTYNWGAIDWCLANRFAPISPHIHIEDGFGPEEKQRQ